MKLKFSDFLQTPFEKAQQTFDSIKDNLIDYLIPLNDLGGEISYHLTDTGVIRIKVDMPNLESYLEAQKEVSSIVWRLNRDGLEIHHHEYSSISHGPYRWIIDIGKLFVASRPQKVDAPWIKFDFK